MLKKLVATLMILMLAAGTVLPVQAYSDTDIGYEGRICRDLGILKGNTGVVDSEYLRTKPSRLQAAIMFLRLKGLEQEALDYNGSNNFKDAAVVAWKEGRNVLSYLKNHPQLGWIGDGVNFLPLNSIDSKAYYKVLLESLGYKQRIDGEGDFDWSSVLEYAKEKGLDKVAGVKDFTVGSLAVATVEALGTKMKSSDKKLIEYLVDIGDVDREDAISLGLYRREMNAVIKSVRAISNSKVEVVFEEAVDGSAAVDEDLYTIKQLDIKELTSKNSNAIIIDTSAMSESSTYTLEFNDKSYSFKGLKKDGYAPKLITAECKDTDLVELSFDRVLDNETAQDSDTYSIEGIDVKSAELDSTNTKVRLKTEGIQAGRPYELKINNIKNGDGVTTKLITKRFTGKKDTSAPKLNKLTVLNNVRLLLEFSDANGLDKTSAQDEDSYRITYSGGSLDVEAAQVKDSDDDGLWDSVELVTESQETGRAYTLIIEDISDGSVLRNKITKEIKKDFRGKSKDKTAPTVARNPKAVTDTMVEIEFEDANALDVQSACDLDNYDIDEELEIREIRIKNPDDLYSAEGRTVQIITSEMEKSESYTLVIRGITDEFGNEMKTSSSSGYKTYRFKGAADDRTPPYITSVECLDSKTIELNFDNLLEEESAENISNYRVDGLALATKAVLQEDGKTVRLTVSSLSSDRSHTMLLNNIRDLSGNALSNVSVSVLYNGSLNDDDPPEVSYIEAMNEKEVWIHFEEEIYAEAARMKASGISFEQVGNVLDDGTTIVMKTSSKLDDEEYEVTSLTGVWDLRNNAYELESNLDFYGTDVENDPPEVDYWEQMDIRRFRAVFTEPVLLDGNGVSGIKNPSGVSISWTAVLNPDEEDTNEAYSTIDYEASKDIPADKEFRFDFTDMVTDYTGLGAYDEADDDNGASGSTILESYMEDDDDPYIEYVEAITKYKAQVIFSEAMRSPGSYEITYEDDDNKVREIDITLVEVDTKDKTRVNIYTGDAMSDEYLYILEPKSAALDIAGNRVDIDDLELEFYGSNIMSSDYIQGVEMLNAYTLKVSKSGKIYNPNSITLYELDSNGSTFGGNLKEGSPVRVNDNVYKIASKKALLRDVRYKINVDGLEYKFYGGVQNGDLELELPERDITYDDMDMDEHYVEVYRANGDKMDVDKRDDHFEIDGSESLINGEMLYVYVKRESDNVVIYGTRVEIEGMPAASSSKEITSFSFKSLDPDVTGTIDREDGSIELTVPYGTDLDNLAASFNCSDNAVVKIGSVTQISGETKNDFSHELTYTVIAQDGSKKYYSVKVAIEGSIYEKKITAFEIDELEPEVKGVIDHEKREIALTVPFGTEIKALEPSIAISPDTTIAPGSGEARDFSVPVVYKLTARDGSTESYTVKVTVAQEMDKSIEAFEFGELEPAVIGRIDERTSTVNITVPYKTDLTKLVPTIKVSDNSEVIPEPGKAYDFSEPMIFKVKAADGTTREYTVKVKKALNTGKSITSFSFEGLNPQVSGNISERSKTITLTVPYGTELANLAASFEASPEAVVKIGEVEQESGKTENDFTKPVTYTVVAQNNTAQNYIVTVSVIPNSAKLIEEFGFAAPQAAGIIDQAAKSIKVQVPKDTDVTKLAAVFKCSDKATVKVNGIAQESGKTTNNFTNPVIYTVAAQDGSIQNYTVTVKDPDYGAKYMNGFSFAGLDPVVQGEIIEKDHTIKLYVPEGTTLTNLAATFSYVGKSVEVKGDGEGVWIPQVSGVTYNDFSKEVIYRITAHDGSMAVYTVTVTITGSGA